MRGQATINHKAINWKHATNQPEMQQCSASALQHSGDGTNNRWQMMRGQQSTGNNANDAASEVGIVASVSQHSGDGTNNR